MKKTATVALVIFCFTASAMAQDATPKSGLVVGATCTGNFEIARTGTSVVVGASLKVLSEVDGKVTATFSINQQTIRTMSAGVFDAEGPVTENGKVTLTVDKSRNIKFDIRVSGDKVVGRYGQPAIDTERDNVKLSCG